MTTVAYKDGVMAADSQISDGSSFCTRINKLTRLASGAVLGQSGEADIRDIIACLDKCTARRMPSRKTLSETKTDFSGILAYPSGKVYLIDVRRAGKDEDGEWGASVIELLERYTAVGSGAQYAIGAMAAGRTAKYAVEIACRFDGYSNPPVREVTVKRAARTKA